jgi:hypothetical protein
VQTKSSGTLSAGEMQFEEGAQLGGNCQLTGLTPPGPLELGQVPPAILQPGMNFGKLLSGDQAKAFVLPRIIVTPKMIAPRRWDDARIDPKILAHPPQSTLGVQPPGTQVAQNEYPNLLMLLIDSPSVTPQPAPSQWPGYRLKAVCTQWSQFEFLLIHSDPKAIPAPPAK